jgi:hypothetical protein
VKSRPNDNANSYTFSIENEGFSYQGNYGVLTAAQLASNIEICCKIADYILTYNPKWRADRDHVIGHYAIHSIAKPSCPAPNFGEKFQWDAVIAGINSYIDKKMGTTTPVPVTAAPTPVTTVATTAPTSTVAATGIQVGTKVKVRQGALTYSGGKVASFVYANTYPVSSFSGDRCVLDSTGICTPFNVKDLTVVSGGVAQAPTFKVGTYVKIKPNSMWATNPPKAVPSWATATYVIDALNGTTALLSKTGINSPIDTKYLTIA